MIELVVAFFLALALSLVLTPLVGKLARSLGFVDHPDGGRKTHEQPVALGGGAAVFLATLAAVLITFLYETTVGTKLIADDNLNIFWGLLTASVLIVILGLVDDIFALRGRYKLVGQIAVASLLIFFGVRIESVALFQGPLSPQVYAAKSEDAAVGESGAGEVDQAPPVADESADSDDDATGKGKKGLALGLLAIPFTLLWLLGAINAINLIDGIDGLASSVGLVLCLTFAAIMGWRGETAAAIIMLALGGALLGFLRYNFAPASVFLGDAGSMLIGLLIGTIAIASSTKSAATVALAVPVAVWSVPILDSAAAILRRKLTGRSVFAADRGHLHHSLLVRGWSVRQAVLFIGLISAMTCISAVLGIYFRNEIVGLLMVFAIIGFLIFTETFGHIELALIKDRFRSSGFSFSRRDSEIPYRESSIQLQGARQWDTLWTAIIESADSYRLTRLKLIIHIPGLHEDYFASWNSSRNRKNLEDRTWQVNHPLIVDDVVVGHLEIVGVPESTSTLDHIIQVLDFLEPIEEDIDYIMKGIEVDGAGVRVGQPSISGRRYSAEPRQEIDEPITQPPLLNREKPAAIN